MYIFERFSAKKPPDRYNVSTVLDKTAAKWMSARRDVIRLFKLN